MEMMLCDVWSQTTSFDDGMIYHSHFLAKQKDLLNISLTWIGIWYDLIDIFQNPTPPSGLNFNCGAFTISCRHSLHLESSCQIFSRFRMTNTELKLKRERDLELEWFIFPKCDTSHGGKGYIFPRDSHGSF